MYILATVVVKIIYMMMLCVQYWSIRVRERKCASPSSSTCHSKRNFFQFLEYATLGSRTLVVKNDKAIYRSLLN